MTQAPKTQALQKCVFQHDATATAAAWDAVQLYLKQRLASVNDLIMTRLESRVPLIPEVAAHLIAAGGKRVRPALLMLSAQLFNYEGLRDVGLAACIEFIHTATLLHDDVVDVSAERRGVPAAHLIWGNSTSILVGDFLFSKAFEFMVEDGSLEVLGILSKAASQIAEGEVLQLVHGQDLALDEATYFTVIESKTAALFQAATVIGGIVAGAGAAHRQALQQFGTHFGLMFQLIDDWLDYGANAEKLNKRIGDDFREGKVTYPLLVAARVATPEDLAWLEGALTEERRQTPEALRGVQGILHRTGALAATRARAEAHGAEALAALDVLPIGRARDLMTGLVQATLAREC